MNEYKVEISGWNKGFSKVKSTNLIQRALDLDLFESKSFVDRILAKEHVNFTFANKVAADRFESEMTSLGAVVHKDIAHTMKINRILTNICSHDLEQSKSFYTSLFDLTVGYDSDWFVHLQTEDGALEIGIMQADHELVPEEFRGKPAGLYMTLVVDDVMSIYAQAKERGFDIVKAPELTFYGQKRLLLKDPSGVLVDVSSPENAQ